VLMHELAHTAQQAAGPVVTEPVAPGLAVSSPGDHDERAADQAAHRAVADRIDRAADVQQPGGDRAVGGLVQRAADASGGAVPIASLPAGDPQVLNLQRDTGNQQQPGPGPTPAGLSPDQQAQLLQATTTLREVQPLGDADAATLQQAIPGT